MSLIARSELSIIDTANPTVPVVVIPAPDPGVTNLVYNVNLYQGDLASRDIDLYLTDGVIKVYLVREANQSWTTNIQYPPSDSEGPLHQVAGWDLMMVSDAWSGTGSHWTADANYAEDTGDGLVPSDYKWEYVASPAAGLGFDLLATPDTDRARIIKHVSICNEDTPTPGLGVHTWWIGKNDGVVTAWFNETGSMNTNNWVSWVTEHARLILVPGTKLFGFQSAVNNNAASHIGISYLEAGGVPRPSHSDIGPWTRWPPVAMLHSKSVDFVGVSERLETYAAAQLLGIANAFTVACWVKPEGNDPNTQWVFMHGQGSNVNRIHLYRDTQESGEPWRIHIRDNSGGGGPYEKDYRFGPSLALDQWYLIACTWDGTDLLCYVNGVAVTPSDLVADDSGASVPVMADSSRQMSFGGISTLADTDGFEGRGHSAGSWSSVLTATELLYLFRHPGMDWRIDEGAYASKADNEHYYLAGLHGSPNIGHDYGLGSNTFDLATETGITDVDIVDDAPGV